MASGPSDTLPDVHRHVQSSSPPPPPFTAAAARRRPQYSAPMTTSTTSGQSTTTSAAQAGAATLRARTANKKTSSTAGSQTDKRRTGAVGGKKKAAASQAEGQQVDSSSPQHQKQSSPPEDMPTLPPAQAPHPKWVLFALFSGAFAALNGVFAKLTTSSDTPPGASLFTHILPFLDPTVIQILLRSLFFGLNLASNAVMWVLFTRALTSHPSTTKVSVVNTSANFTLTAVMGAAIFRESVGGVGGIAGLALLVGGCVVLGAKKEEGGAEAIEESAGGSAEEGVIQGVEPYRDDFDAETAVDDEDLIELAGEAKAVSDPGAILDGTESDDDNDYDQETEEE